MEFMSRGGRQAPVAPQQPAHVQHPQPQPTGKAKKKRIDWVARTVRFELFIVIVGSALILLAISLWLATGNYKNAESKQVNDKQYQAVFLTNNQVYFGKITDLNNKFIVLKDVFYIENPNQTQDSTSGSNANYTLRKLGSTELHSPEDEMIINREQVTFWENLKDSGQVVTKIKEYKQNPSSQDSGSQNTQQPSPGSTDQAAPSDTTTPPATAPTQ
jgi:hypothetical protein